MRADQLKPDVSTIDPEVLRAAGVDLSKAPGTELIDPSEDATTAVPTAPAAPDPGAGIDDLDDAAGMVATTDGADTSPDTAATSSGFAIGTPGT